MGYFCNEAEPEGEDWGKTVVKDIDQTMSFAVNTIPLRRVLNTPYQNGQTVKQICLNTLVRMLAREYDEQTVRADNQQIAALYFINIGCQLLINRPSFIHFIL